MKATKLMIGDWILCSDNMQRQVRYLQVRPSVIGIGGSSYDEDEIQPIPLTREILEKNGFTGGEYKSYTGDVWYLEEEGFRKIGLTMSRKESTLWGEKIKPLSPDSIGHNFAVPNIKFVHELQHALRLCGIDKDIEI